MAAKTALVIDQEQARGENLKSLLDFIEFGEVVVSQRAGWDSYLVGVPAPHMVILGQLGSREGLNETIAVLREKVPELPILVMDADDVNATVDDQAAAAVFARLKTPFRHRDLSRILHNLEIYLDSRQQTEGGRPIELFRSLVGQSRGIREVRGLINRVAHSDATVLILGESGTGKEVVPVPGGSSRGRGSAR